MKIDGRMFETVARGAFRAVPPLKYVKNSRTAFRSAAEALSTPKKAFEKADSFRTAIAFGRTYSEDFTPPP